MKPKKINADLPDVRSVVRFRNMDTPCMVITAEKAKVDAKNFRDIAKTVPKAAHRDWLNDMAAKFEALEGS